MKVPTHAVVFALICLAASMQCASISGAGNDGPLVTLLRKLILFVEKSTQQIPPQGCKEGNGKGLRIASFNIQVFGKTKASKETVMDNLVKIMTKFDVICVQEIRDKSEKSLPKLVDKMKKVAPYKYITSKRLGRSSNKEQYAFVYRSDKVKVTGTYQSPDPDDLFEREPYAVKFYSNVSELKEFVMMGIHTKPTDALSEINELDDEYQNVVKKWGIKDVIIAGDFNADCTYVGKTKWDSIDMWVDKSFSWLIKSDADTTVKSTDCAYDRFVVTGRVKSEVVAKSVQVYRFDKILRLNYEQATAVSDHYPIEMTLRPKQS